MVTFTCGACGESVKKAKVEAHCFRCKECWVLSCVDCGKDFQGDAYAAHTSCISEAEKYQGSMFKADGAKGNKPDVQTRWMAIVRRVASNAHALSNHDASVAELLQGLAQFDNVPRKQKKFDNFMLNSFKTSENTSLEKTWSVLQRAWNEDRRRQSSNKQEETENERKRERNDDASETQRETKKVKTGRSGWKREVRGMLKKAPDKCLSMKKILLNLKAADNEIRKAKLKAYVRKMDNLFELNKNRVKYIKS